MGFGVNDGAGGAACTNLAIVRAAAATAERAVWYSRACDAREPVGCVMAAALTVRKDIPGASMKFAAGGNWAALDCRGGSPAACRAMAAWNDTVGNAAYRDGYVDLEKMAREAVCKDDEPACRAADLVED